MVMTSDNHQSFMDWLPEIRSFVDGSESLIIGVFDFRGKALYLSGGMRLVLGVLDDATFNPHYFVVPSFNLLLETDVTSGVVYQGWLTFGGDEIPHRSVFGQVLRRKNTLLVIAEYDVEELERTNREITQLNGEITNLQRELARRRNQLEQALIDLRETQVMLIHSEKMAALGQIVAGVAHEINNPVAFVMSNLHSLKSSFDDMLAAYQTLEQTIIERGDTQQQAVVARMRETHDLDFVFGDLSDLLAGSVEGLRRIKQIVEDLRLFSRLDEAEFKEADLTENIRSTLAIVQPELRDRVEIVLDFDDVLPLSCYPAELNQVFMNLIVNAMQAMENTGTLTIRGHDHDDVVVIEFSDTGHGMSDNVLKSIFTPFYTTKPAGIGTGLGLALSRTIIEEHHRGSIRVESTVGQGTTFIITLPKDLTDEPK